MYWGAQDVDHETRGRFPRDRTASPVRIHVDIHGNSNVVVLELDRRLKDVVLLSSASQVAL